jgi:hypothetical protein
VVGERGRRGPRAVGSCTDAAAGALHGHGGRNVAPSPLRREDRCASLENLPGETRGRSPGRRSEVDREIQEQGAGTGRCPLEGGPTAAKHVAQVRTQASGPPLRPSMGGYGSTVAPEEAVSPP